MYAQGKARSILFYNIAKEAVVFVEIFGRKQFTLLHFNYSPLGYYFSLENSLFNMF